MILRKLNKFRALSAEERRLLLQASVLLPLVRLGLRLSSLRRVQLLLARWSANTAPIGQGQLVQAQKISRLVDIVSSHSFCRANSLERSLVLWWLLRRKGIASELRLGVRKVDDTLESFAWMEYDGVVLNASADIHDHFAAFDEAIDFSRHP